MTDEEIKPGVSNTHEHFAEIPEITVYEESSEDSMTKHKAKSVKVKARNEVQLSELFTIATMDKPPIRFGFTCGAFDLLHPGHMLMLKECRTVCNHLTVGLQIDPSIDRPEKNKPVQTIEERITMLDGCIYVDEIILYKTEKELYAILKDLIARNRLDIRIIGEDWQFKRYTGWDLQVPVYFNSRKHTRSTTELRKRVCEHEKEKDRRSKSKR